MMTKEEWLEGFKRRIDCEIAAEMLAGKSKRQAEQIIFKKYEERWNGF